MLYLYIFTGAALLVSLIASRRKTLDALKVALKRFLDIAPALLVMLILVSAALYAVPGSLIAEWLGGQGGEKNRLVAVLIAALLGSIALMPGFIAFPLCGILLSKGVPYMVLSAFSTTLMMVGVLTYPIEKAYFGPKVTIIRNVVGFFIALAVAFATGVAFGEIF